MNSLMTALLLMLAAYAGALACDSNPTPHPINPDARGDQTANVPGYGNDFDGPAVPNRDDDENDLDPTGATDGDGAGENSGCPDTTGGDAIDEVDGAGKTDADASDADDDDATDAGPDEDDDDADDATREPDCGSANAPAAMDDDNDRVEDQ